MATPQIQWDAQPDTSGLQQQQQPTQGGGIKWDSSPDVGDLKDGRQIVLDGNKNILGWTTDGKTMVDKDNQQLAVPQGATVQDIPQDTFMNRVKTLFSSDPSLAEQTYNPSAPENVDPQRIRNQAASDFHAGNYKKAAGDLLDLFNPDKNAAMKQSINDTEEAGKGFAKSAGQTVQAGANLVTAGHAQPLLDKVGLSDDNLQLNNSNEKAGAGVETILEFALGDEALKGLSLADKFAQGGKIAKFMESYPKLANVLSDAIRSSAVGGVVGAAHSPGDRIAGGLEGAAAGGVLGGGLSAVGEGLSGVAGDAKNLASDASQGVNDLRNQNIKDVIKQSLGSKADSDVVNEAFDRMDNKGLMNRLVSPVENELKLVKPQVDSDLTNWSTQLNDVLSKSNSTVTGAKDAVTKALDDLVSEQKAGVGDPKDLESIQAVKDRVLPKLNNDSMSPLEVNNMKRLVGEQVKKFAAPDMLNSSSKAEQEAYRQAYFSLRDLVSEAVPESKQLNTNISKAFNLQDLLEKKFPQLETQTQAQNSYRATKYKNVAKGAAKVAGAGLLGDLAIKGLSGH